MTDDSKETAFSRKKKKQSRWIYKQTLRYYGRSHKIWNKIKPDTIIPWRRSGHSIPPLNKKLPESILAGTGENHFSPVEWHRYIKHSRVVLIVRSSLQDKTNSMFFTLFSFVVVHQFLSCFSFYFVLLFLKGI